MITKYPLEVASVVRKNKTMSITSYLYKAKGTEGENPYEVYGKFSRFSFSILDLGEPGNIKTARINVKPDEIADIKVRTKYALREHLDAETKMPTGNSLGESYPAYTSTFRTGAHKGMTPASVLLEGKAEELKKERAFLQGNVGRYPANKQIIAAIDNAFDLQKANMLRGDVTNNNNNLVRTVSLFYSGLKPQQRKQREDGKCEVHEMNISWQVGAKYPVEIAITNYYASVNKQTDGRLLVGEKDNSSRITIKITLDESEWMNTIRKIDTNMHMFEILQARELFKEADQINRDAIMANGGRTWSTQ